MVRPRKYGRICANAPFCWNRLDDKYPNKKYCSNTCKKYAYEYRKANNLMKSSRNKHRMVASN